MGIQNLIIISTGMAGLIGLLGMSRIRCSTVLISASTIASILVWKQYVSADAFAAFLPALVSMMLTPGYLIARALPGVVKESSIIERLPLYFGLSIFFWTVTALFAYRAVLSADLVILFCLAFDTAGLAALYIRKGRNQENENPLRATPLLSPENYYSILFIVITLLAAALVGYRSQFHLINFDAFDHLAGMGKIAANSMITGGDFFLGPPNPSIAQYASNPWYLATGLTSRLIGRDVAVMYVALSSFMMVLTLFTFRTLISSFTRNTLVATIGTTIAVVPWMFEYAVRWKSLNGFYFETLPFPASVSETILYPLLCAYIFRYLLEPGRARYWVIASMLALATVGQHLQFAIWIPFIMGCALAGGLFLSSTFSEKRNIAALIFEICLISALIGYMTVSYPLTVGPEAFPRMPLPVDNLRYKAGNLWVINNDMYAMDPGILLQYAPILLLFLAVVAWAKHTGGPEGTLVADRRAGMRLVTAALCILISPLFVVLNPLLVPKLVALFQSDVPVYRMSSVNDVLKEAALYGSIAWMIVRGSLRWRGRIPAAAFLPIMAIAVFLAGPFCASPVRATFGSIITNAGNYPSVLDISRKELFRNMSELRQGVVAASPFVGKYIVAFTPHYSIAEAFDINMLDKTRFVENDKIITYGVSDQAMKELLDKYRCRYVVVSLTSPGLEKFEKGTGIFRETFRTNPYAAFSVRE